MSDPIAAWLTSIAFDTGRYLLVAVPAFAVVWWWGRERFRPRLIYRDYAGADHLRRELWYSASTVLVFSLVATAGWFGHRAGVLRFYGSIDERGWAYWVVTVVALVVLHDTYFYWTHRAMHHRWLFRRFHRVHHLSTSPSPLAAYAFAPLEAAVQALFVPLAALALPIHRVALFVFLVYMIVRNVLGHLGVELFPPWFVRNRWSALFTTTTHHALHHKKPRGNYGLYFTFWDRAMGTTHADYEATFERVTAVGSPGRQVERQAA